MGRHLLCRSLFSTSFDRRSSFEDGQVPGSISRLYTLVSLRGQEMPTGSGDQAVGGSPHRVLQDAVASVVVLDQFRKSPG